MLSHLSSTPPPALQSPRVSVYIPLELLQQLLNTTIPELVHYNVMDAVHAFQVRRGPYLVLRDALPCVLDTVLTGLLLSPSSATRYSLPCIKATAVALWP